MGDLLMDISSNLQSSMSLVKKTLEIVAQWSLVWVSLRLRICPPERQWLMRSGKQARQKYVINFNTNSSLHRDAYI